MSANPRHIRGEPWEKKRRLMFVIVALLAVAVILLGIKLGDLETIRRFAGQI